MDAYSSQCLFFNNLSKNSILVEGKLYNPLEKIRTIPLNVNTYRGKCHIYGNFSQRLWREVRVILSDLSGVGSNPTVSTLYMLSVRVVRELPWKQLSRKALQVRILWTAPVWTARRNVLHIRNLAIGYDLGVYRNFDGAENVAETKKYTEILTYIFERLII